MAKADEIKARIGLSGPLLQHIPGPPPAIPAHELVRRIGKGSYGEVWLARSGVGTWRAVKVVYRDNFKDARPYEREFSGIQKYEPISRSNEGLVDVLQIGRNDAEGYFYYIMELADAASAECGARSAEPALSRPAATLSHPMGEGRGEGSHAQPSILNSQPTLDPASYIPKTLACEIRGRGRLPVEECIPLGLTLNLALGHLHRHGLIHRDVKPSNIIFVNGVPKLADIGLVTDLAEAQSFVGTEGFIPPEGPNSAQADIYALGKVLYEAAMGKDRQEFPEPFTGLGVDAESQALMELNEVLLKACAASPKQRYQSAEEMNADLALLHSGQSVRDKHALQRRLKITTRVAVAVVAAMVLGVVPYYLAIKEARLAKKEAAKSQQVAQFLTDMLKGVGPSVALGRDTKMLREILDNTAEHLGKDLTNQPEVEIELRLTLAGTYWELGLYTQEETMARESLRVGRSRLEAENPAIIDSLSQLGQALTYLRRLDEAEVVSREAVALSRKRFGQQHTKLADSLSTLGEVLRQKYEFIEAEAVEREALSMRRKLLGSDHRDVAESLNDLAIVLESEGKLVEAETMLRESLAMDKKLLGNEHPEVATAFNNLAAVLHVGGKLAEAETLYREALAIKKQILGPHPSVAVSLHNLALVLEDENKLAEAETLLRQALAMYQNALDMAPGQWVAYLNDLVDVLKMRNKWADAEALSREYLPILRARCPENDPNLASALSWYILTLLLEEKFVEAEAPARECLAICEQKIPDDLRTFRSKCTLGYCLLGQKKYAEAEPLLISGYEGMKQRMDQPDARGKNIAYGPKKATEGLVQLYKECGRPDQAAVWKKNGIEFQAAEIQRLRLRASLPEAERQLALPIAEKQLASELGHYTSALLADGQFAEAEAPARESVALYEKQMPDDWHIFHTRSMLGGSLLGQRRYAEAEPFLVSGYEGMKQRQWNFMGKFEGKQRFRDALERLVQFYEATGRSDQAAEWKQKLEAFDKAEAEKKTTIPQP